MSYQNLAEVYDRFAYDFDYDAWTDWYEKRILDLRPGSREICDVGCGTGPLAVRLAQKGYKVTGIGLVRGHASRGLGTKCAHGECRCGWFGRTCARCFCPAG